MFGDMEESDRRLLSLLRENARASTAALARELKVSRTTVQSRIARLERSRVITGYTVRTSEAHERGTIRAMVMITVAPKQSAASTPADCLGATVIMTMARMVPRSCASDVRTV